VKENAVDYADLEIGLHRRDAGNYAIEFRFSQPNSEADVRLGQGQPLQASFNLNELHSLLYDPPAYARRLTQSLFAEPAVQAAFAQVRASAQAMDAPLRIRMLIGPSAPELHALHWELLCDPHDGEPLSTRANVFFSRYMSSVDWRPVRLRARDELTALALIANPSNLADYDLAPVDVPGELERIQHSLADIALTAVPEPGSQQHATLNMLIDRLRASEYDILYLVCHGALIDEEPWLWLEDEQGKVARTSGAELVSRMKELDERPRLLVLASCESAGAHGATHGNARDGDAMAALGPRLAEAGIPAVLAMQDRISVQTVAEFMPPFFRELQRDGQIDRAAAVAREMVCRRPDYWVPVLFMRLKSGRIWYVPGFAGDQDEFEKWSSLAGFVQEKTCTPIVGPGLFDRALFPRREIAMRWAEKHGFPLSPRDRDVLPRVAQYVTTHQSAAFLAVALREVLRDGLLRRYGPAIPSALQQAAAWSTPQLVQALNAAANYRDPDNSQNAYRLLANLRLPIYVTTDPFDFLERALADAGAQPVTRACPWNKFVPRDKALYEDEPTPDKPLVYHLFGHIGIPNSLVFSEDHYFDYLIGVTLNKSLIPSAVRAALTNTSLLFLGFQMDDWEFRVFFRFLMAQEGREMLKFYSHAAAQVEPEEDRITDVRRTHRYLEEYFQSEHIGIYWGSTEDFLTALSQRIPESA
jgi:hypothetical protein